VDLDPDVSNEIPADYVPADPARVVFFGDSITDGTGASAPELQYTALLQANASAWPGFDDVTLPAAFPALTEFDDFSVGGATTDTMLHQQIPAMDAAFGGPVSGQTVVIFTIGGNDLQQALLPFNDAAQIVDDALANFEQLVDALTDPARFPDGVFLYATNVYEPTDAVGQAQECFFGLDFADDLTELDRYNAELAQMGADRGFAVLDLRGHFLGHGYHAADPSVPGYDADDASLWFAPDCIHPNDRGHHEIRRLFQAAVAGEPFTYRLPE
jgi:lysophospholipase L1-like esterase